MEFKMDWERVERIGLPEAVHAQSKTPEQISAVVEEARQKGLALLVTRLEEQKYHCLGQELQTLLDYDPLSRTAILPGAKIEQSLDIRVAIVTGGLADMRTAREATRTLEFSGIFCTEFPDIGVAGLWRLMERLDEIRTFDVVIAVAGMEGAIFSVLGGLISAPLIAVPSPVGDGVAEKGQAALTSALASCASGIVTVNIGNGFGAAHAAMRMGKLRSHVVNQDR
ncbi:nickel pincer cofactor biosynthesis protein LarB [Notoacmeibacter sp. MSK16QG-6]|uniref:nickel pincer cofactor biosynthesis protein LarB n=1 Tax=Notoacmeibacter sp. MSK16QG-6 TaxID=2957982 RepID=UPI00209D02DC|nr:nickel pincer cofactor biosynthesis protein LarB [Notoacmeibacter sp. MSK16QG-6]MCP1199564.1 nickel pincer cofactor biosynthesis protein LarB [Notoacmeibacter sp. MSK16QG-6]